MVVSGIKVNIKLQNDALVMDGPGDKSTIGCILRGVLDIHLDEPTRIKSIDLVFSGRLHATWVAATGFGARANHVNHHQPLIHHRWKFITSPDPIPAGNNAYDFELPLTGNLPLTNKIDGSYNVDYQLKATIQRSAPLFSLSKKHECQRNVYLTRQIHDTLPISVKGEWNNKLSYTISIPSSNNISHGDVIPVKINFCPLVHGIKVIHIDTILKQYVSCPPIKGLFEGKSLSQSKIIYSHSDVVYNYCTNRPTMGSNTMEAIPNNDTDSWSFHLPIPIPNTLNDIQYDSIDDKVNVQHRLKFVINVETIYSHFPHLMSSSLKILIQPKQNTDCPPAYQQDNNDSYPHDPNVMAKLL